MKARFLSHLAAVPLGLCLGVFSLLSAPGDENWDPQFGVPGANSAVQVIAYNQGMLYAGGNFSKIGGVAATNVAKWDGTNWFPLGSGVGSYDSGYPGLGVRALAVMGTDIYVAGNFTNAGSQAVNGIAKWDGANWSSLGTGVLGLAAVTRVGTNIYVGGHFGTAGGISATNISRWDGTNWSALGGGLSVLCNGINGDFECGAVRALAVIGTEVYAAGQFRTAGEMAVNNIAKWDGTNWSALGAGLRVFDAPDGINGNVRTLLARGSELFAGGEFRIAGEVRATNIARWNGTNWFAVGGGVEVGGSGSVYALALNGADVYAGGAFSSPGGISAQSITKWDGTNWFALGSGVSSMQLGAPGRASVQALAATGSELYLGGIIETAGGKPSTNIALWHIPHPVSAKMSGNTLTLSWPATGSNFVLESNSVLGQSSWSAVSQTPVVVGNQLIVTNSMLPTNQFFRLRRR